MAVNAVPILYSAAEVLALPTSGAAYTEVLNRANATWETPNWNQNSNSDTDALSGALVGVRNNNTSLLNKAKQALRDHIGFSGYALENGRNMTSLLVAANIMGFAESAFVTWVGDIRDQVGASFTLPGQQYGRGKFTMTESAYEDPGNFGTMNMATLIAIDLYLGNDISAHVTRWRGYLGDSTSGWDWTETAVARSWQPFYPTRYAVIPVGGIASNGVNLSGCPPEDARRDVTGDGQDDALTNPPVAASYNQEGMQGTFLTAAILTRQGYPVSSWNNNAILRMHNWVDVTCNSSFGGDDENSPWLVQYVTGTTIGGKSNTAGHAKNIAWCSWTHQALTPPSSGPVVPFMEGYESPAPGDFVTGGTGYSVENTTTVYQGSKSREFGITGANASNSTRREVSINWALDVDVWYGAAVYLDPLFYSRNNGAIRLMAWNDNNGTSTAVRGGIWINPDDRTYLDRTASGTATHLLDLGLQFIPAATWTMIEVFQTLSEIDGTAVSRVYKNGVLAGTNTATHNIDSSIALGNLTKMEYGMSGAGTSGSLGGFYVIMDRCYADVVQQGPFVGGTSRTIVVPQNAAFRNQTAPLPKVFVTATRAGSVSSTTIPVPTLVMSAGAAALGQIQTPFRTPPRPFANVKIGSSTGT